MASLQRRRPENVTGDFYVDSTCIDCDTCRWMAPATFDRVGEQSRVHRQPTTEAETARALEALVACPTSSIGASGNHDAAAAAARFPLLFDAGVYHLGFHDEASFGATSWLVPASAQRGGVMVDVPRWNEGLARRIEALGGASTIFLTHQDDVGAHERWAARLGSERILHAADIQPGTRGVERILEGDERVELGPDLVAIPTPGHTRGSTCLLVADRLLFTGDHLAFSRRLGHVYAFHSACWYDWEVQIGSVERLTSESLEWILPGHGTPCRFERAQMQSEIQRCVAWMRTLR